MSSFQTLPLRLNNSGPWTKNGKLPRVPTTEHVDSSLASIQNTTNLRRPLSRACGVAQVSRAFWNHSRNDKRGQMFWQGENSHIQFLPVSHPVPPRSFSCGRHFLSSEEQVRWDTTVGVFEWMNEKWPCRSAGSERKERKATLYHKREPWSCFPYFWEHPEIMYYT